MRPLFRPSEANSGSSSQPQSVALTLVSRLTLRAFGLSCPLLAMEAWGIVCFVCVCVFTAACIGRFVAIMPVITEAYIQPHTHIKQASKQTNKQASKQASKQAAP